MDEPRNTNIPTRQKFYYVKGNWYRVIRAHGVWGGIGPTLDIQMTFFNQRAAIPQVLVHKVSPDGEVLEEITGERETKDGIVREVEATILMDLEEAKSFRKWLDDKITNLEKIREMQEAKNKEGQGNG